MAAGKSATFFTFRPLNAATKLAFSCSELMTGISMIFLVLLLIVK
jgi:hypothetical protein